VVDGPATVVDGATVVVRHNVSVAPGAMFDAQTHSTVAVRGNVYAGSGSLIGLGCTPAHPCDGDESETESKHDTVGGNVVVTDLTTTSFGVIRSTIGGSVILKNIRLADPDGDEVVANTIGRNLIRWGNNPAPQFGDAVEEGLPGVRPEHGGWPGDRPACRPGRLSEHDGTRRPLTGAPRSLLGSVRPRAGSRGRPARRTAPARAWRR
jgi:hypothetical protein